MPLEVSLVIPVRDEELSLPTLLESIGRQTCAPAEIVIVDGGSTDATVPLARRLTAHDARFRVIEAGPALPGRGRNIGVAAARHEWIAFTDAGIRLEPDWLEQLTAVSRRYPEAMVVYGEHEPVTNSFFQRCAALAYFPVKQARPGGRMRSPFIASSLMRRSLWRAIGGFPDMRAAEDLTFVERVDELGFAVAWAPDARVWWQMPTTLGKTFRRCVLYSRHNVWAGRQRLWHYGVARFYVAASPFVALGVLHSAWWFTALVAGLSARAVVNIWRRREQRSVLWAINPARVATVAWVILALDLATMIGWVQALVRRPDGPPHAMATT